VSASISSDVMLSATALALLQLTFVMRRSNQGKKEMYQLLVPPTTAESKVSTQDEDYWLEMCIKRAGSFLTLPLKKKHQTQPITFLTLCLYSPQSLGG
jgi:hypothetical protein